MRMPMISSVGLLLLIAAQNSLAEGAIDPHIRAGIGVGQLRIDDSGFDEHSTGWNLFVGFELNRYIAVEAGRIEGNDIGGIENFSWHGSAVGSLPVGDSVAVYARAGLLNWHATIGTFKDDDIDPFYGLGIGLNIDNGLLRLEYNRSKILDLDASYVSLSAVWRFGL